MALALFTKISIDPKLLIIFSTAFSTCSSNLISVLIGRAFAPSSSISFAAVKIVPGNLE